MVRTKGVYPEPWRAVTEGREKAALGDVVGLTQFGVNLTRLKPGAASALRHWHEADAGNQDRPLSWRRRDATHRPHDATGRCAPVLAQGRPTSPRAGQGHEAHQRQ